MSTNTFDQRLQEAAQTRRDFRIELLTIGVIAGFIGGWFLFGANRPLSNDGYITNVFTELISIGLTVFVITEIFKRREIEATKKRLVRQAGSVSHPIAINAIEELRANGWLTVDNDEQLLVKAGLVAANLENATLFKADLRDSNLVGANVRGAFLMQANVSGADFGSADVSGAKLTKANVSGTRFAATNVSRARLILANVSGAEFQCANVSGANFGSADVRGVNFYNASLRDVNFQKAIFDEETIMPDAKEIRRLFRPSKYDKYWTPETDMTRYTDPNHPDFWQPDLRVGLIGLMRVVQSRVEMNLGNRHKAKG